MTKTTILGLVLVALTGCADDTDIETADEANIVEGDRADRYPYAALVDVDYGVGEGHCSGAVIAPTVVLTAAHCTVQTEGFRVIAPYAVDDEDQPRVATSIDVHVYDWGGAFGENDRDTHDIALIELDRPIVLDRYPEVLDDDDALGDRVRFIGRIDDGELSHTDLFVGGKRRVYEGEGWGYPHNFLTFDRYTEQGDSGGPVVTGRWEIAGVDTGGAALEDGRTVEMFARADLVHEWIAATLQDAAAAAE